MMSRLSPEFLVSSHASRNADWTPSPDGRQLFHRRTCEVDLHTVVTDLGVEFTVVVRADGLAPLASGDAPHSTLVNLVHRIESGDFSNRPEMNAPRLARLRSMLPLLRELRDGWCR